MPIGANALSFIGNCSQPLGANALSFIGSGARPKGDCCPPIGILPGKSGPPIGMSVLGRLYGMAGGRVCSEGPPPVIDKSVGGDNGCEGGGIGNRPLC